MQATRRAFLSFTIAVAAFLPLDAVANEPARKVWQSIDLFVEHCLSATPSPEAMASLADQLGWLPLSDRAARDLTAPLGVIPGVHRAWSIGASPDDIVVEVGGTGAWSFAAQDQARMRGDAHQGPMPNVAEPGADDRFGFSNHWTCKVHFRGGDPEAIIERLLEENVRTSPLGEPLSRNPELQNRPGWASVNWFVPAERSMVSFTYRRDEATDEFTRELSLGFFTPFENMQN